MSNLSLMLDMLEDDQSLKISPIGCSMCPFFYGGRDYVYLIRPSFPLKKGDIALFQRTNGIYVIHRVYKVSKKDSQTVYYMLGDNQTWVEGPVYDSQIHAVTAQILRKGHLIDCKTNRNYRLLSWIWLHIRPLRPIFIRGWIFIKPKLHKQQKSAILTEIKSKGE